MVTPIDVRVSYKLDTGWSATYFDTERGAKAKRGEVQGFTGLPTGGYAVWLERKLGNEDALRHEHNLFGGGSVSRNEDGRMNCDGYGMKYRIWLEEKYLERVNQNE
jgi:hypothetical protein